MLETGIKGRQEVVVSDANSAKTMGSGTLDVFATPAMTALMEKTAWMSVADQLDEGCGTVGTLLNAKPFSFSRITVRAASFRLNFFAHFS